MILTLAGLITYLLLTIYCHEEHGLHVSINRVRELRNKIVNETWVIKSCQSDMEQKDNKSTNNLHAIP